MVKIIRPLVLLIVIVTTLAFFTSCEPKKENEPIFDAADEMLGWIGHSNGLVGTSPTDYGVLDNGETLNRTAYSGESFLCDPETGIISKIYVDKENFSVLGLRIGMTRADAESIISDCRIKETMLFGDDYKTESIIDKYNVVVTWRLSDDEIKKFGLYCLDVANHESEIYKEDHGGKTANEKLENFMKSNGLVGMAVKIEVSLAENASE